MLSGLQFCSWSPYGLPRFDHEDFFFVSRDPLPVVISATEGLPPDEARSCRISYLAEARFPRRLQSCSSVDCFHEILREKKSKRWVFWRCTAQFKFSPPALRSSFCIAVPFSRQFGSLPREEERSLWAWFHDRCDYVCTTGRIGRSSLVHSSMIARRAPSNEALSGF